MRSEWQTHKGQQLFFCNYANLESSQLLAEMDAVEAFILQQPVDSSMLCVADLRGISATRQIVDRFIKIVLHTKKQIRKSAVIGVGFSGPKKVLFDSVMRVTGSDEMVFEDIVEAKDWLVAG